MQLLHYFLCYCHAWLNWFSCLMRELYAKSKYGKLIKFTNFQTDALKLRRIDILELSDRH